MSQVLTLAALPLWAVMASLGAAVVIFLLGEHWQRTRTAINLAAALV
ncbi:MAG: hypothetical protein LH491_06680 [Pseudoxanthomonas sp.]|nr:hypothetical protein [Pseudoxanthomonas sp.]